FCRVSLLPAKLGGTHPHLSAVPMLRHSRNGGSTHSCSVVDAGSVERRSLRNADGSQVSAILRYASRSFAVLDAPDHFKDSSAHVLYAAAVVITVLAANPRSQVFRWLCLRV